MDTLIHADVFFFITTIVVLVVGTFLVIALIYIIEILKNFRDISKTFKKGTDKMGESAEAVMNFIINNKLFQMFFGNIKPKAKRKTNKKDEKENK